MAPYLSFVERTIATLIERQSARLGGKIDGTLFLTVTNELHKSYFSLGKKYGGRYRLYSFPQPLSGCRNVDALLWGCGDRCRVDYLVRRAVVPALASCQASMLKLPGLSIRKKPWCNATSYSPVASVK